MDGSMWQEPGKPNWVGHLLSKYISPRCFDPADPGKNVNPVLVYDFAVGGDTVAGVARQVHNQFLKYMVPPPEWAPWTPEDTLFVIWVGINDCAYELGFQ
jgi:hypothetical protein